MKTAKKPRKENRDCHQTIPIMQIAKNRKSGKQTNMTYTDRRKEFKDVNRNRGSRLAGEFSGNDILGFPAQTTVLEKMLTLGAVWHQLSTALKGPASAADCFSPGARLELPWSRGSVV
jgi:hypothetical protein